ncbi:tRNA lysidine(34) synthetase TilS [Candidatus Dependentiae bacterium]|nr:tRNA lysidine(34) synthetase TilS [Candidatus Dependentiae bacterium]
MSEAVNKVLKFIKDENLIEPESTIIIGLSGGPDSVFLLHVLKKIENPYKLKLIAAHLNHEWRKDAEQDVIFCKKLCKELEIDFVSAKASDLKLSKKYSGSKEDLGRQLRREFFEKLKKEYNADLIALGHHLDDQLETFFIRLIRGSSITGLAGIKVKKDFYVRPLLCLHKQEILDYLDKNKIKYVEDITNLSDQFLRNKIRKYVIPALKKCDERFEKKFLETLKNIAAADDLLERITLQEFKKIEEDNKINLEKFNDLNNYLQDKILLLWLIKENVQFTQSTSFFKEIKKFLKQKGSKKHKLSEHWHISKQKNWAEIVKEKT